jgi:hypothetical protein
MRFLRAEVSAISIPFKTGTSHFTTDVLHSFEPEQAISDALKRRIFFYAQHEQSHSHAMHMPSIFRKSAGS